MSAERCATCRFCREAARWSHMATATVATVECRHGAPGNDGWPVVRMDDWCGCYETTKGDPVVEGLAL